MSSVILTAIVRGSWLYSHSSDGHTEAQAFQVICPKLRTTGIIPAYKLGQVLLVCPSVGTPVAGTQVHMGRAGRKGQSFAENHMALNLQGSVPTEDSFYQAQALCFLKTHQSYCF